MSIYPTCVLFCIIALQGPSFISFVNVMVCVCSVKKLGSLHFSLGGIQMHSYVGFGTHRWYTFYYLFYKNKKYPGLRNR